MPSESSFRTASCSTVRRDPAKLTRSIRSSRRCDDRRQTGSRTDRKSLHPQTTFWRCGRLSSRRNEAPHAPDFGRDRCRRARTGPISQNHKVEELTEILRMIEVPRRRTASGSWRRPTGGKLSIPPCWERKIPSLSDVDYPTKGEVELALQGMLKDRPHDQWICPQ